MFRNMILSRYRFIQLCFLAILCLCATRTDSRHALYISVVEIKHDLGASKAQMKLKVFTDDLEDAVFNRFGTKLLNQEGCYVDLTPVQNYFDDQLEVKINGQKVSYELGNCERLEDSTWLYFEFTCPVNWGEVFVRCNYFMELFPTQTNVISVTHGAERRYFRVTQNDPTQTANFNP